MYIMLRKAVQTMNVLYTYVQTYESGRIIGSELPTVYLFRAKNQV